MSNHAQSCKDCKKSIYRLLSKSYGEVKEQYNLDLPAQLNEYRNESCFESLKSIHEKLQNHRDHRSFVRVLKLPRVDYYLPAQRTVIEFDESQHFTQPRLITLESYPEGLTLGYSRQKWMDLSRQLNRHDNNPQDRDEQRAWYDTLRDFSTVLSATRAITRLTVRLYAGDKQWCSLDADKEEDRLLFAAYIRAVEK